MEAVHKLEEEGLVIVSEEHTKRDIKELKTDVFKPTMAWIEITTQCNMKCLHCYNESDIHCSQFMAQEEYQLVVDNLVSLQVPHIQLIGGEPFVDRTALKQMLDYVDGKFESVEVFTNGTLVTDDWFPYLAEHDIHVALSVYSYKPEIHDFVTKNEGSWNRTNRTIAKLKEYGIKYRVCNVLMKGIELGVPNTDLYELSKDNDIVRMSGRASFSLLTDELIRKRLITQERFFRPINKKFSALMVSGHNCFSSKLYIAANLDVFPCVMERRIKHCNIKETGKIEFQNHIRRLGKDCIKGCKCCEYRYACFDCRPNSLSEDTLEKPWYCTYDPETATWQEQEEFIKSLKGIQNQSEE